MSDLLRDLAADLKSGEAITVRARALSALNAAGPEWRAATAPTATLPEGSPWWGLPAYVVLCTQHTSGDSPWRVVPNEDELHSLNSYWAALYTAWIVDPTPFTQPVCSLSLDVDSASTLGGTVEVQQLILDRIKAELLAPVPENSDLEDPLASFVEAASDQYGSVTVDAVARALKDAQAAPEVRERLTRALGFVRNGVAVSLASDLLADAILDKNVHVRDAAVSAMGFGADPERSSRELRVAAETEPVPLLRTVMLQSAEQLEAWGRRRAAIAQDRTKKVDRPGA